MRIQGFTMERQSAALNCWLATAKAVLDYFRSRAGLTQDQLFAAYNHGGHHTGDPEWILRAEGAVRNSEALNGNSDEAARIKGRLFLRIVDSINRNEPVLVNLRMKGGESIGHSVVIYEYVRHDGRLIMKDPSRPTRDIEATMDEILLGFTPYGDDPAFASLWCFAEKLIFTINPYRKQKTSLAS